MEKRPDLTALTTFKSRSKSFGFSRVLMRACILAGLIDIAFFFIFLFLNSSILAWVNIVSIGMYASAFYAFRSQRSRLGVQLMSTEILIHAALGIVLLGWESGFHYYLMIFIPAVCVGNSRKSAITLLFALFVFYCVLACLNWFINPIQPINPVALQFVHIFNLSVVFALFSYLSLYYINKVKRANAKLHLLATTDPMTELLNRRHMAFLANREIARLKRYEHTISVIIIDIDHFKQINDVFGHEMGDKVIIEVARLLQAELRETDLISRWGGEEFLIVLPIADKELATQIVVRMQNALLAFDWQYELNLDTAPTVTVGVTIITDIEELNSAVGRADKALYRGKANGRNRIEFEE